MNDILSVYELKKGMKARVASIDEGQELCPRLLEMGLLPGTEFTVTKIAPLGDPIEINMRGYRLCLRRTETECLKLVRLD